ncbi:MAG: polysaccharide biosynthesis tyrosine autokinase [Candidatus Delongbacteria bacterium]|nr:polysaccharide biosynthesis tyrosine autokinase [Candidatus Delongbacteria bacterium]
MEQTELNNREALMRLAEPEVNFEDYLGIIFRRKVLIMIMIGIIFLPFFYLGLVQPYFYSARLIAVIEEKADAGMVSNEQYRRFTGYRTRQPGYYNLIVQSQPFREELAKALQSVYQKDYAIVLTGEEAAEYAATPINFGEYTGGILDRGVMINNACQLSTTCRDPKLAYHLVNVGFDVLKVKSVELENLRTNQMIRYIQEQKQLLETQLLENENEIQRFRNETGISVGDDLAGVERESQKLQYEMLNARTSWQLEEAKVKAVEEEIDQYDRLMNDKYKVQINYDTTRLKGEYEDLLKKKNKYMENPVIFRKEIDEVEKRIAEISNRNAQEIIRQLSPKMSPALQLDVAHYTELIRKRDESVLQIRMLKLQEKYYQQLWDKYRVTNPDLLQQKNEMARLILTRNVLTRNYNFFVEREQNEKISTISTSTELKMISPAVMPDSPLPRSTKKFWMIGITVAIILSFSLAFFIELFDTTLKTPEDVKKFLLLPSLGIIPKMMAPIQNELTALVDPYLITFIKPSHQVSEAYRSLRTNLEHIDPYHRLKTMLITSPSPFEGKSISISNLAVLFAQKDLNVLLMDLDLRKPRIHSVFHLERKPGLIDALSNPDTDFHQYVQPSPVPNLSIFTVGTSIDKPAEIIGSEKFKRFFENLKAHYDLILVDTPPITVVTDAALLSTYVDGVLMVMTALQTNRNSARYALELMQRVNANILGVLLNKVLISKRYGSYGYYYYKRYYKSYYSYYHTDPEKS